MIKKYTQFVNEADDISISNTDSNKFSELKDVVKEMIETTIKNSGGEFNSFIESFEKNQEDVKVEGFINDADIYDFYLKFRNDIDELLNNIKFYNNAPIEVNAYGLYEYTIKGTQQAFSEIVKMIK